jgi:hypothetical protein
MSDIYDAGDLEYNSDDESDAYDDEDNDIVPLDSVWSLDDASAPLTQNDRHRLQGFIDPNPLTAPPDDDDEAGARQR